MAAVLLIALMATGCQGDSPAGPAEDGSDQSEKEAAATRAAERAALVALYNSTDGGNWTNNTGWLLSDDHCSWFGVGCLGGERVTGVGLSQNNLTGSSPVELGNLTLLDGLGLAGNNLTGSISAELGNLTLLVFFFLFSSGLSGPVPLPVAGLGGQIEGCRFESNPGLFMPDIQDYRDADLDNDGFICGIGLSTPSP